MTQTEINKLYKSIATDFKITARKTELWDITFCYQILHDIKKLMGFCYVESISLVMRDISNIPLKVKKYKLGYTNRIRNDRPGGIDWEDGEGHNLYVVIVHTTTYNNLSSEQKDYFQKEHLKNPWLPSNTNTDFLHLSQSLSKFYTYNESGIDRIDFN